MYDPQHNSFLEHHSIYCDNTSIIWIGLIELTLNKEHLNLQTVNLRITVLKLYFIFTFVIGRLIKVIHDIVLFRYSKRHLWEQFFSTLLNVESCENLPNLAQLRSLVEAEILTNDRSSVLAPVRRILGDKSKQYVNWWLEIDSCILLIYEVLYLKSLDCGIFLMEFVQCLLILSLCLMWLIYFLNVIIFQWTVSVSYITRRCQIEFVFLFIFIHDILTLSYLLPLLRMHYCGILHTHKRKYVIFGGQLSSYFKPDLYMSWNYGRNILTLQKVWQLHVYH